jgi:O-antigen ligase
VHLHLYSSLLLLTALAVFGVSLAGGAELTWSRLHTVAAAYVAWLVILMFSSTLPSNSLLFVWLLAACPVVLLLTCGLSRRARQRLFALFVVAGLTSAGWGIAEFITTGRRADGPLVDPNLWSAINNLMFFGVLANYLSSERHKPLQLLLLFVFALASLVAYSRVGTLIFGIALGFIVLVLASQRKLRSRLLMLVLTVLTSVALVYGTANLSEATSHSEGYTLDMKVQGWSQRLAMWQSALGLYRENPVFGIGPGTYKVHYPRVRTAEDMTNSGNFVHNDYLQFLAEGGPVMLIFLLSLVGWLLVRLVTTIFGWSRGDDDVRILVYVTAMGTVLIHGLMNFTLFNLSVQMLFGLYLANVLSDSSSLSRVSMTIDRPNLARTGGALMVVYLASVLILDAVSHDVVYEDFRLPLTKHLRADQAAYLNTILVLKSVRPRNAANHFALATLYRQSMDAQSDPGPRYSLAVASALSYKQGLELNPFNFAVRRYYAGLLEEMPALMDEEAIMATPLTLYQENVRLAPVYIENQMDLADYLTRTGKADSGYRILVDDALPWADLRHARYQQYQQQLYRKVFAAASDRRDKDALERLLVRIEQAR